MLCLAVTGRKADRNTAWVKQIEDDLVCIERVVVANLIDACLGCSPLTDLFQAAFNRCK